MNKDFSVTLNLGLFLISLFCQYLDSGVPVRSHITVKCHVARDHTQVFVLFVCVGKIALQPLEKALYKCQLIYLFTNFSLQRLGFEKKNPGVGLDSITGLNGLGIFS